MQITSPTQNQNKKLLSQYKCLTLCILQFTRMRHILLWCSRKSFSKENSQTIPHFPQSRSLIHFKFLFFQNVMINLRRADAARTTVKTIVIKKVKVSDNYFYRTAARLGVVEYFCRENFCHCPTPPPRCLVSPKPLFRHSTLARPLMSSRFRRFRYSLLKRNKIYYKKKIED